MHIAYSSLRTATVVYIIYIYILCIVAERKLEYVYKRYISWIYAKYIYISNMYVYIYLII